MCSSVLIIICACAILLVSIHTVPEVNERMSGGKTLLVSCLSYFSTTFMTISLVMFSKLLGVLFRRSS